MLYINLLLLIAVCAAFIICRRRRADWLAGLDRRQHSLYALYPLVDYLLDRTGLYKKLDKQRDLSKYLGALKYNVRPELAIKLIWCKRFSTVLLIFLAFNLLSLLSALSSAGLSNLVEGKYLKRPGHGEGSASIKLQVKAVEDSKVKKAEKKKEYGPYDMEIAIMEETLSTSELEDAFERAYAYIKGQVLGENASFDQVYGKLNFVKTIPGTRIRVSWFPDDYRLIRPDGSLMNEELAPEGVWTNVTAVLTYEPDSNKRFSREYLMSFKIMPRQYSEEELLQIKLKEAVKAANEGGREEGSLELPEEISGYSLIWKEKISDSSSTLLLLGVILAFVAWIGDDRELEKKLKQRKEQMLVDYPEIVNKFVLLINAGMTIKQAWLKITDDYERNSQSKGKKRHAYEEMALAARELRLGMPEGKVYELFGERTGLMQYIKLASLLVQNLKKGSRSLTQTLIYEAREAFEERKETAKRLGETAGTRLLGPMMALLLIVLMLIMIPAFMSFKL